MTKREIQRHKGKLYAAVWKGLFSGWEILEVSDEVRSYLLEKSVVVMPRKFPDFSSGELIEPTRVYDRKGCKKTLGEAQQYLKGIAEKEIERAEGVLDRRLPEYGSLQALIRLEEETIKQYKEILKSLEEGTCSVQ